MSLGIDNMPFKTCAYDCQYCQLGRTLGRRTGRFRFLEPEILIRQVMDRIEVVKGLGLEIDYLTFISNGEPTLDMNLGDMILGLKSAGIKIAVISDASLIGQYEVREDLKKADWVSLKVDTVDTSTWIKLNRPCEGLQHDSILAGILMFSEEFRGELVTETMLVKGINDDQPGLKMLRDFLCMVQPRKSYLQVPSKPPVCRDIEIPSAESLLQALALMNEQLPSVHLLFRENEDRCILDGNLEDEVLEVKSIHPLHRDSLQTLLAKTNTAWSFVEKLQHEDKLSQLTYHGETYFSVNSPLKMSG